MSAVLHEGWLPHKQLGFDHRGMHPDRHRKFVGVQLQNDVPVPDHPCLLDFPMVRVGCTWEVGDVASVVAVVGKPAAGTAHKVADVAGAEVVAVVRSSARLVHLVRRVGRQEVHRGNRAVVRLVVLEGVLQGAEDSNREAVLQVVRQEVRREVH